MQLTGVGTPRTRWQRNVDHKPSSLGAVFAPGRTVVVMGRALGAEHGAPPFNRAGVIAGGVNALSISRTSRQTSNCQSLYVAAVVPPPVVEDSRPGNDGRFTRAAARDEERSRGEGGIRIVSGFTMYNVGETPNEHAAPIIFLRRSSSRRR